MSGSFDITGLGSALYDRIGRTYGTTRQGDSRIAAVIWNALGDARTVLNVGAGAGGYEPGDREVVALEPSPVMIAQRPPGAARVVQGRAEELPDFLDVIPPRARKPGVWEEELRSVLGDVELTPVPVPGDCTDVFYGAFWRRPEAYLRPEVRAGISVFAQLSSDAVDRALRALATDLETGRWPNKHRSLLTASELHLGYYVIVAEPNQTGGRT